jgi:hypothetical protein
VFLLSFVKSPRFIKFTKITGIVTSVIVVLFFVTWFGLRNYFLNTAYNKVQTSFAEKGYTFKCKNKGFEGVFGVRFSEIYLNINHKGDSTYLLDYPMFTAKEISVPISIWRSIWHGPSLGNFKAVQMNLNLVDSANISNFKPLLKSEKLSKSDKKKDDLANSIFKKVKSIISKAPAWVDLEQINLHYQDSARHISVSIPQCTYVHQDIQGEIKFTTENPYLSEILFKLGTSIPLKNSKGFAFEGKLDRDDLTGEISIVGAKNQKFVEIPFIIGGLGFKKAHFVLNSLEQTRKGIEFDAQGEIEELKAEEKRISDTLVSVKNCAGRFLAYFGKDYVEIDSQSQLQINGIKTKLFARYDMSANPHYALQFQIPTIPAQQFFSSLPAGLFRNTSGIKANGTLAYSFKFELEHKKPHLCILESHMETSKDFKVTQWGMANPNKLNGTFIHDFFDKGQLVSSFAVGPSNPFFAAYNEISPDVPRAVMKSEDPSFFYHRGFYTDAFRSSIAQNYRLKRFARGGSTISMQLVKNVFLGRKKTMARKIEEILLVWLIEDQHIVSKTRMLEVYLNIIEWGPGIFGIGEAADFYFDKHPSQINLGEATFLASIIPSPKNAGWAIDSTGTVKDKFGHFRFLKNRLLAQDSTQADTTVFNVKFSPRAMRRFKGKPKTEETTILNESDDNIGE